MNTSRNIRIDRKSPYITDDVPRAEMQPAAVVKYVSECMTELSTTSPKTVVLLGQLFRLLMVKSEPEHGYEFRRWVSRSELAAALHKPRLVRYDIVKLDRLAEMGLIETDRRALPARTVIGATGDELYVGAGWEHIYGMETPILYAMLKVTNPHAFDEFYKPKPSPPVAAAQAVAEAVKPMMTPAPPMTLPKYPRERPGRVFGMTRLQVVMLVVLALALVSVFALVVVTVTS